jgi:hypothetical protein
MVADGDGRRPYCVTCRILGHAGSFGVEPTDLGLTSSTASVGAVAPAESRKGIRMRNSVRLAAISAVSLTALVLGTGVASAEVREGGPRNDTFRGTSANDVYFGRGGDDTLIGGPGRDYLEGNAGADVLRGQADNDVLDGGNGPDQLFGGKGNDLLRGGQGADFLRGQAGKDILEGGAGPDELRANDGERGDVLICGPGRDVAIIDAGDIARADCETVVRLPAERGDD